jgi:hypothetical protein
MISQLDLHSKHIPLSGYRVSHNQETDVFVAERVKLSIFRLIIAHSNVIRAIIIILEAQVSNSTVVIIIVIEAKVGISSSFRIVKTLVVRIIKASFIVVQAGCPPLLLLRVDQLRRPAFYGEEEKQNQCKLHAMPLRREDKSVARPVIVKQEQEVVDAENGLLPDRDIELDVSDQRIIDILISR